MSGQAKAGARPKRSAEYWEKVTVKTGKVRFSYPYLFEPYVKPGKAAETARYKLTILIPKDDDISALKKAANYALKEAFGMNRMEAKAKGVKFKWPFKNGDKKQGLVGYADHWYLEMTSIKKPGVFGTERDIEGKLLPLEEDQMYGGCYGRVELNAFPYDTDGNKGVSFGIRNVQKLEDGESFGGRRSGSEVFDDDASSDDDDEAFS